MTSAKLVARKIAPAHSFLSLNLFANSIPNSIHVHSYPLTENWSETLNIHYKLFFSMLLVFKIMCISRHLFLAVNLTVTLQVCTTSLSCTKISMLYTRANPPKPVKSMNCPIFGEKKKKKKGILVEIEIFLWLKILKKKIKLATLPQQT